MVANAAPIRGETEANPLKNLKRSVIQPRALVFEVNATHPNIAGVPALTRLVVGQKQPTNFVGPVALGN